MSIRFFSKSSIRTGEKYSKFWDQVSAEFSSDYELISTTVLGSDTASVTFDNLGDYSSTYKHLQIRVVARGSNAANFTTWNIRVNGDTGSNYARHDLYGNGTAVESAASTSQTSIVNALNLPGNSTTNTYGAAIIDLLDPYSTSKNKTFRILGGRKPSDDNVIALTSGLWNSTSSVTSITLTNTSASFTTNSRFSLYGIKG